MQLDRCIQWFTLGRVLALLIFLVWVLRSQYPQAFDRVATASLLLITAVFGAVTSGCFTRLPDYLVNPLPAPARGT